MMGPALAFNGTKSNNSGKFSSQPDVVRARVTINGVLLPYFSLCQLLAKLQEVQKTDYIKKV